VDLPVARLWRAAPNPQGRDGRIPRFARSATHLMAFGGKVSDRLAHMREDRVVDQVRTGASEVTRAIKPELKGTAELRAALNGQPREILLPLHVEYGQRWKHDSNQIWAIGLVFIPLSLSGIAVPSENVRQTVAIAVFSTILIWIWYLISQSLRARLDQEWAVYSALESELLNLDPPKLNHGLTEFVPPSSFTLLSLRRLRLVIAVWITIAWVAIIVLATTTQQQKESSGSASLRGAAVARPGVDAPPNPTAQPDGCATG
jgi:hypothetical protein